MQCLMLATQATKYSYLKTALCHLNRTSLFFFCPTTHDSCICICMHHTFICVCFIYHDLSYMLLAFSERSEMLLCTCENVLYMSYNPAPKFISQTSHFPASWNTENFPHKHHRKCLLLKKIQTLIHDPLHAITHLQNGREAIKIAYCVSISLSPGEKMIKAEQYHTSVKI